RLEWRWRKKRINDVSGALVAHVLIIGAIGNQKLLVVAQERGRSGSALVPEQHCPSAGLEDAHKLAAGRVALEPVCGLRRGDNVDRMSSERGSFRSPGHAGETRITGEKLLSSAPHFGIGLDAEHRVAVFQQHAGENAGAGSNISDHRTGS